TYRALTKFKSNLRLVLALQKLYVLFYVKIPMWSWWVRFET
ncbi:type II secretion system (T2SS), E, N-terminal domain protein, partial [Vibrio parahaemolyticus VPTS-2010_2]